ncbi:MAG: sodium-dependent transporter [Gammaproteobacteria bacterium]
MQKSTASPAVHEGWSSRFVFIMAAVGAAVGLGNLWKFPYTAGVSGGAAFVVVYLVAVGAVAVPIVIAELLIGRRGRMSPPASFARLAEESGASGAWRLVGFVNLAAVFIILSFYSVVAGWGLAYVPRLLAGHFAGADADTVARAFDDLLASPVQLTVLHTIFMAMTVGIVSLGIHRGIEKAVKFLMPALFLMLLLLVGYAAIEGDMERTVQFLFQADFSKITAQVVLQAIGQAFFSVSVAMGLLITYGAYLDKGASLPRSSVAIAGADTLVALLAGLAIFPIVFAHGLDPAEGPGLVFVTLPLSFAQMPAGGLFGAMFFVLLIVSALTSTIAVLEPMVAWAEERKIGRRRGALLAGGLAWLLGLATVFSFNAWKDFHPLGAFERFANATIFDLLEFLTTNILLPVGGVLIAVFAGWVISRPALDDELPGFSRALYALWRVLVRYLAPVAIGWVLIANTF